MTISRYLSALRRRAFVLALIVVFTVATALLASLFVGPSYSATSTVRIGTVRPVAAVGVYDIEFAERLANTYGDLIQQSKAVEAMRQEVKRVSGMEMDANPVVEVEIPANTELLDITVHASTAESAAAGANALATELVRSVVQWSASQSEPVRVDADVVDAALPPSSPAGLDRRLVIGVALLVGLLVGLQVVVVMEKLDRTLWEPQGIATTAAVPLLGRLERRGREAATREDEPTLLRLALELTGAGCSRVVVCTDRDHDVSSVAVGLARAFAAQQNQVLLTGVARAAWSRGEEVSPSLLLPPAASAAGRPSSDPFSETGNHFDVVVVHTQGALIGSEATLAARQADTSVLVLVPGHTTGSDVSAAVRQLSAAGPVAGVLTVSPEWIRATPLSELAAALPGRRRRKTVDVEAPPEAQDSTEGLAGLAPNEAQPIVRDRSR